MRSPALSPRDDRSALKLQAFDCLSQRSLRPWQGTRSCEGKPAAERRAGYGPSTTAGAAAIALTPARRYPQRAGSVGQEPCSPPARDRAACYQDCR